MKGHPKLPCKLPKVGPLIAALLFSLVLFFYFFNSFKFNNNSLRSHQQQTIDTRRDLKNFTTAYFCHPANGILDIALDNNLHHTTENCLPHQEIAVTSDWTVRIPLEISPTTVTTNEYYRMIRMDITPFCILGPIRRDTWTAIWVGMIRFWIAEHGTLMLYSTQQCNPKTIEVFNEWFPPTTEHIQSMDLNVKRNKKPVIEWLATKPRIKTYHFSTNNHQSSASTATTATVFELYKCMQRCHPLHRTTEFATYALLLNQIEKKKTLKVRVSESESAKMGN